MEDEIDQKLVGWKITESFCDRVGDYFGFAVTRGEQEREVWALRDREGNGNGFLGIGPAKKAGTMAGVKQRDCRPELRKRIEAPPLELSLRQWWDNLSEEDWGTQIFNCVIGLPYYWIPKSVRDEIEKDKRKRQPLEG